MSKPQRLPFPTDLVLDSPHVVTMNAVQFGALLALATSFWRANAQDFGSDEATLSVLARCHTRRWHDIRERVVPAWNAIKPHLVSVYAEFEQQRAAVRRVALENIALAHDVQQGRRAKRVRPMTDSAGIVAQAPLVRGTPVQQRQDADSECGNAPKRVIRGVSNAKLTDSVRNVA